MSEQKQPHVIKCTSGDTVPSRFALVAADVESLPLDETGRISRLSASRIGIMTLRVSAGRVTRQVERVAYSPESFWDQMDMLTPAKSSVMVLCNGALRLWTVLGLWEQIQRGRYAFAGNDAVGGATPGGKRRRRWRGFACLENPPFICLLRDTQTGSTMRLVDVRNWGQSPQPAGTPVGEQLQAMAVWLLDWLDSVQRLRLGTLQSTTASQAYYGWRRSYYDRAIERHENADAHALERAAYYGGRNECQYVGEVRYDTGTGYTIGLHGYNVPYTGADGPIIRLDINSAYAAAAAQRDVPVRLLSFERNPETWRLFVALEENGVIADVTVETNEPCVPYSLHRHQKLYTAAHAGMHSPALDCNTMRGNDNLPPHNERIVYPVGRFRAALCGPELQLLLNCGQILKCHALAQYEMAPAFKRWGEALWQERQRAKALGRNAVALTLKTLPVCLFGRLGQQRLVWVDVPHGKSEEPYTSWYKLNEEKRQLERWRCVGYRVQRQDKGGETNESVPMIPAFVNSLARVRLWDMMKAAGQYNLFYVDTDSLWVNHAGYDNLHALELIDPSVLGKLKIEAEYHRVEFIGQKHYYCDGQLTCAAMPQDAHHDIPGEYWFNSTEGFPHALPYSRPPYPVDRVLTRRPPCGYNVGLIGLDGWTLPLTIHCDPGTL